jgi:hypothetical protein
LIILRPACCRDPAVPCTFARQNLVAAEVAAVGQDHDPLVPRRFLRLERHGRELAAIVPLVDRDRYLALFSQSLGGVGVSRLDAAGTVYNLRRLADFEGVYGQARSGWAAGDRGRRSLWMQNAMASICGWSAYAVGYR